MTRTRRPGRVAAAVITVALCAAPSAFAITPPAVDPGAEPPSAGPGPVQPMEQRGSCGVSTVIPGSDPQALSPGQAALNLPGAWQSSRGAGQLVAVIDTGVQPGARLPKVEPGGDFVENTDGLTDCDGHGTLIAGIIAGQPAGDGRDGFSGVAPAAHLLSIRVTSSKFSARSAGADPATARATLEITALGRAIVHAADLGAKVIAVSTATCVPVDRPVDQGALGAAIKYAAVDKDAVIVAAAGNTGPTGSVNGGTSCDANPLTDVANPGDPRNWSGVRGVSVPSWWQPYVLSTASLNGQGQPSAFTMSGPWVGIAAPGEGIVSVSNRDGATLANALTDDRGNAIALTGTGYATGYVAGVAALVRSKYPELNAAQVMRRITATAHSGSRTPSDLVGAGSVDAVAALTWDVPAGPAAPATAKKIALPPVPAPADTRPRAVALAGSVALAALVALAAAVYAMTSRRRKDIVS